MKKSDKTTTEAADPFSKDRDYNITGGKPVDIRKSDKPATEFINVHVDDKARRVNTDLSIAVLNILLHFLISFLPPYR